MPRQAITLNAKLENGSWALARHIRRDAPWLAGGRIKGPITTFFECARTGAGVDIYVVDTGLRYSHQEFGGRGVAVGGTYGSGAVDDQGHGTEMAAMAGGATVGMARGAGLRIVKGLDSSNLGSNEAIAAAIDLARADYLNRAGTNRPAVVNLSLFSQGTNSSLVGAAAAACIDAGMVVVTSAGNNRSSSLDQPALTPGVIVVGGIRANDTPYYIGRSGTNWGARVDVLAAAELAWTARWTADDAYGEATGTSGASALAAGAIACMLEGSPRLTTRAQVHAIRDSLIKNATRGRFVPQPQFGIGFLPDRILYLDPAA